MADQLQLLKKAVEQIVELKQRVGQLESQMSQDGTSDVRMERLASRLSSKYIAEYASTVRGEPGHTPTDDELRALIRPLIPDPIPGEPGQTPTDTELLALIRPLIPEAPEPPSDEHLLALIQPLIPEAIPGQKGDPGDIKNLSPEEIRNSLELLQGDERLDKSAVKGIEEIETKLKEVAARPSGTIRGMRKVPIVKRVSLTSQVDGNTRTFNLPLDTTAVLGVWGTEFPITFDDADWTFAGHQLTLASGIGTPQTGQTLFALVETLFY